MQQLPTQHFYKFGEFRLDLSEKILSRDSETIPLTPKVFDTLQILVENPGRLLEKEFLMREIWRDNFVEENNLATNIKTLRKALGDSAGEPRFIETVPRRGYRFVAQVKETFYEGNSANIAPVAVAAVAAPISTAPIFHPSPQAPRNYFSSFTVIGIMLLLLCTIGGATWFARNQTHKILAGSAPVLAAPFHSEKLTGTGNVAIAAISPDGKSVAYVDKTSAKFGLWLRSLESSERTQIVPASDDYYLGLSFSHDGKSIYFVKTPQINEQTRESNVYRIPASGGVPEEVVKQAQGWFSLSPDDRQISFVRCNYQEQDFCSLFVADSNGQNERKISTKPKPYRIADNQFSPDGKTIAFASGESWNGDRGFSLEKIDLASGVESKLSTRNFFDIKSFKWLPDGQNLLLTAMENLGGRIKIWRVAANANSDSAANLPPLTNDDENYVSLSLSRDADKILASQIINDFHLYFASDSGTGAAKALTNCNTFTFTPDGKIFYATFDGDLWRMNREGSEQRQMVSNTFSNFSPTPSPDGRFIFFTSNRTGTNQVWRMDAADAGNQIQLTKTEGGYPHSVSPDGKWVYYESGLNETLWRVSAEGGEESQIYDKKVFAPTFSPDGNWIAYFFREKQNKIAIVNLANKKIVKVLNFAEPKAEAVRIAWAPDSQTLKYITQLGSANELWSQTLNEEKPHFLADLGDGEIMHFALAPDGNSYAFVRGEWLHDAVLISGLK